MRVLIQGLVLAAINLAGIVTGFVLFSSIPPSGRTPVQGGFALVFTILAFVLWTRIARGWLMANGRRRMATIAWCTAASLIWVAVIFSTLHYTFSGYLTSFSNILAIWVFQVIANPLALLAANAKG